MIIHEVEQGTDAWFKLRLGIPTASEFAKIVSPTGKLSTQVEGLAYEKAFERLTGVKANQWDGNSDTDRGNELEPEAANAYSFIKDIECVKVGFVTNNDKTFGASPDRFVSDGLLEIKCPSNKVQNEILAKGKVPTGYMPQLQGQMMVCEKEWCDFFAYNQHAPVFLKRVYRDEDYIKKLSSELVNFEHKILETLENIKKNGFSQ